MSKKYKGKICVYCRKNMSTTADHVFPREMFQLDQRSALPKVPSCTACNNEKSKLEHYLLSVLPFGATHSNSEKALSVDTAKRLSKNLKLHRILKSKISYKIFYDNINGSEERMTVPLNSEILHDFIGFAIRGLIWHHWRKYLPLNSSLKAFTPSPKGIKYLNNLFELTTKYRVNCKLGDDTISYKGAMSEVDAGVTVWAIQLLGGMTLADEMLNFVFNNSFVAVVSGNPKIIDNLKIE